jgi:hypothetical protein
MKLLSAHSNSRYNAARIDAAQSSRGGRLLTLLGLPLFAVVLGLAFFGCFRLTRIRLTLVTGVLWILYGVYEFLMQARVLCSGECNIRVDLLLIYPFLLVYTLATALRVGKVLWHRRKQQAVISDP